MTQCPVCDSELRTAFSARVLQKYEVAYRHCDQCGFVGTEKPYWLNEAYSDAIVVEEIRRAGLYEKIWQAFAVLLPVQSVGVMGDERSYGFTIAVRVVDSEDAMTADWTRLPAEVLERISTRIVNEVPGINRVVYDISSKPPSTIEWE